MNDPVDAREPPKQALEDAVRQVLIVLAPGHYKELHDLTAGRRLPAEEISDAVESYGRTIVKPPFDLGQIDSVYITDSVPSSWSVWHQVWTREEGRSDLTIEVTVTEVEPGRLAVELDGIEVP